MEKPIYKRIVIKNERRGSCGEQGIWVDWDTIKAICNDIRAVKEMGVEICIVVEAATSGGAGAVWEWIGSMRITWGMLAIINAMALQDALEQLGSRGASADSH